MTETAELRLKRLRLRSWRRGTREMDLLLGRFADARLGMMAPAALDAFEALLAEDDTDLMAWLLAGTAPPPQHAALLAEIAGFAADREG